jgi:hypothetical protein
MLAWSAEEAGRIIETYKIFENKPPDMIMEKQESNPYQKVLMNSTQQIPSEKLIISGHELCSLPYLQDPTTGPNPEPNKSSPHIST